MVSDRQLYEQLRDGKVAETLLKCRVRERFGEAFEQLLLQMVSADA